MNRQTCALLCGASLGAGEKTSTDKSRHTLLHPTPASELREMSTHRPDTTESPYSVDAGHLQIEMDLVSHSRDRHTEDRDGGSESWSFASANIKLGLTNRCDLQVIVPVHQEVHRGPRGFGDVSIRLKANLWGNDGGDTALAVMPFIKIPSGDDDLGNGEVEGGLIVPFAASLPNDWNFGAMLEVDFLADDDGFGRKAEFVTTFTFGHAIAGDLGGYAEFVSIAGTGSDWIASLNAGLTYALTDNVQLDAGVSVGLTRAAEDMTTFAGLSYRF
jgi:hypothetical protein